MGGKKMAYCRRFRVKGPRHSETIFAKKRYTFIVARVRAATVLLNTVRPGDFFFFFFLVVDFVFFGGRGASCGRYLGKKKRS